MNETCFRNDMTETWKWRKKGAPQNGRAERLDLPRKPRQLTSANRDWHYIQVSLFLFVCLPACLSSCLHACQRICLSLSAYWCSCVFDEITVYRKVLPGEHWLIFVLYPSWRTVRSGQYLPKRTNCTILPKQTNCELLFASELTDCEQCISLSRWIVKLCLYLKDEPWNLACIWKDELWTFACTEQRW